jgi:hypothetical protein
VHCGWTAFSAQEVMGGSQLKFNNAEIPGEVLSGSGAFIGTNRRVEP